MQYERIVTKHTLNLIKYLTLLCSDMLAFEKFTNHLVKSDQIFNLSSFDLQFTAMPVQESVEITVL